ncbi:MAG: translation initiation factor IF-2 subunit gamma [archaeon]|nr:translation initiation factor IF-2 subunit gamma [archaeon]
MSEKKAQQAEVNVGVIGHVDHGKSALVKSITGKLTDTHSEEIKRGISIRLGYADATVFKCKEHGYTIKEKCPQCKKATEFQRKISFIDAPGHETLMATMLSGAALMNGALLVIAANEECPQPRTIEHLMALKIGEIKNVIVVQNKIDLVTKEQALKNYEQIKKFLKENGYENSPIIPTAATSGTNIDLLLEAIEKFIPSPKFDSKKPLRMFVARSFDINKPGTLPEKLEGGILGGSIMQGKIKIGQEIEILPGIEGKKLTTKVIELSTSDSIIDEALPGGLIAIKTLLDPSVTKNDSMRGQVIGEKGSLNTPTMDLNVKIVPFERMIGVKDTEIKTNDTIVLNAGTTTAVGRVTGLKKGFTNIALKNPVIVEKGQRIAISKRENSGWRLVAYGIAE